MKKTFSEIKVGQYFKEPNNPRIWQKPSQEINNRDVIICISGGDKEHPIVTQDCSLGGRNFVICDINGVEIVERFKFDQIKIGSYFSDGRNIWQKINTTSSSPKYNCLLLVKNNPPIPDYVYSPSDSQSFTLCEKPKYI